jgi:hypothetical protein
MGTRGFYPRVKRPVCEAGNSPPTIAEVTSEWSYTSTPPTCLHGADRDNIICFTPICFNRHNNNLCNLDNGHYKYCSPVLFGTKFLHDDKEGRSQHVGNWKCK